MKSKLKPFHGNVLLLICAILFILIGSEVQAMDMMKGLLITEFILIMLPAFIFAFYLKGNIKEEFRFNKFTLKEFFLVTVIMITLYPVAVFLNYIMNALLSTIGELHVNPIDEIIDTKDFIVTLLVIAGSAGLCEEILFRGFIMRSYEGLGQWKAILLSGLFFGMFHFNLQNLLGPILLGIVIGYIVIRTNSLWMGIYAHMLNNAVAIVLARLIMLIPDTGEVAEPITLEILLMTGVILIIIAGFFGTLSFLALKGLKRTTENKHGVGKNNTLVIEKNIAEELIHTKPEDTEGIANDENYDLPTQHETKKVSFWSWIPIIFFVLIFIGMSALQIFIMRNPELFFLVIRSFR
ncbi:CPBP family intramembrane metalloprotease [Alkalicella caledoniensis]|uniref:CPBP family intramembrane metalloprotease n=1 Tax=Alkalicella caledoniensis TaxID=2731377 RepID=A0A7G9WAA5_ALKCA|nr:type II CAAX endopeptidase family protein [Alkalicella caledoniensis]QNO15617.1 CPBP family intramembrane metalloprotease [Alkalicella caledoniensis]